MVPFLSFSAAVTSFFPSKHHQTREKNVLNGKRCSRCRFPSSFWSQNSKFIQLYTVFDSSHVAILDKIQLVPRVFRLTSMQHARLRGNTRLASSTRSFRCLPFCSVSRARRLHAYKGSAWSVSG